MIKIEVYADTAAEVRKQMLELLNLDASQTIAISISPEATTDEVETAVKKAEADTKAAKVSGKATKAPPPETTPAAAIQPEPPPLVDMAAVAPEPTKTAEPELTLVDVRAKATAVGKAKGSAAVKALLDEYSAASVSALAKEHYRDFFEALDRV